MKKKRKRLIKLQNAYSKTGMHPSRAKKKARAELNYR